MTNIKDVLPALGPETIFGGRSFSAFTTCPKLLSGNEDDVR